MTVGDRPDPDWDFFISYTQPDRAWAEWIAWLLERALAIAETAGDDRAAAGRRADLAALPPPDAKDPGAH